MAEADIQSLIRKPLFATTTSQHPECFGAPNPGGFVGFNEGHAGVFFRFHPRKTWKLNDIYHGPPKPTFLEGFMVHNLVFRWPKPLFFLVLGAHGIIYLEP